MQTVAAAMSTKPTIALGFSFSFKNTTEKMTVNIMLALSIGTTTLTCPLRIA